MNNKTLILLGKIYLIILIIKSLGIVDIKKTYFKNGKAFQTHINVLGETLISL